MHIELFQSSAFSTKVFYISDSEWSLKKRKSRQNRVSSRNLVIFLPCLEVSYFCYFLHLGVSDFPRIFRILKSCWSRIIKRPSRRLGQSRIYHSLPLIHCQSNQRSSPKALRKPKLTYNN